jgi:hypothetical protein
LEGIKSGRMAKSARRNPIVRKMVADWFGDGGGFLGSWARNWMVRTGVLFRPDGTVAEGAGVHFAARLPRPVLEALNAQMYREGGQFGTQASQQGRRDKSIKVRFDPNDPANAAIVEQAAIEYKRDEDGNLLRDPKTGKLIAEDFDVLQARAQEVGNIMAEVAAANGVAKETVRLGRGEGTRYSFTPAQWDEVAARVQSSGTLNSIQKSIISEMVAAMKGRENKPMLYLYQAALETIYTKSGRFRKRYRGLAPEWRSGQIYDLSITKDGNVLAHILDREALWSNVRAAAKLKSAEKYGYYENPQKLWADVGLMMQNHQKMQQTGELGLNQTQFGERLSFLNAVFGNIGTGHKEANTLVGSPGFMKMRAPVRSFRVDRTSKATPVIRDSDPLPFDVTMIRENRAPEPTDAGYSPEPVTPQQDAAYMQAVESGDVETQQGMVDEMARSRGWEKTFHGTQADENFTVFEGPVWTTRNADEAGEYGKMMPLFVNLDPKKRAPTPAFGEDPWYDAELEMDQDMPLYGPYLQGWLEDNASDLRRAGYTWIWDDFGPYDIILDPASVKSADPVTYDDTGNVIPLSQRFNEKSPDIRYSPEGARVSAGAGLPAATDPRGFSPGAVMAAINAEEEPR